MRRKRLLFLLLILLIAFIVTAVILVIRRPEPPLQEIESARKALSEARASGAEVYAATLFKKASALYDSTMKTWTAENDRWFFRRDYEKTAVFAGMTIRKSLEATEAAISNNKHLNVRLPALLKELDARCKLYDIMLKGIPFPNSRAGNFERGKLLLSEARYAFNKGKLSTCWEKIGTARIMIEDALQHDMKLLRDYFDEYPQWVSMAEKTVSESRKTRNQAIVIDKFNKKCFLYQKGKLKHTFTVELGKKWIGYKRYRGDMATPEGYYRITEKKRGKQTKYHKALLIDYPNVDDRIRFKKGKENGSIPANAAIGGSIEIHGGGGKGINWTDGCVALRNDDMDVLFSKAGQGTRVTIVGSLTPIKELSIAE